VEIRLEVGATLLFVALFALKVSLSATPDFQLREPLINFATDLVTLAITVLIIDVLLERRSREESCKRIAWRLVESIDRVVWVWLGGYRGFDLHELKRLLIEVDSFDSLSDFTVHLLELVGSQAEGFSYSDRNAINSDPRLTRTIEDLRGLSNMREEPKSPQDLRLVLYDCAERLASVLGVKTEAFSGIVHKDSSEAGQKLRFYREFGMVVGEE
jgi:hypothetical protein